MMDAVRVRQVVLRTLEQLLGDLDVVKGQIGEGVGIGLFLVQHALQGVCARRGHGRCRRRKAGLVLQRGGTWLEPLRWKEAALVPLLVEEPEPEWYVNRLGRTQLVHRALCVAVGPRRFVRSAAGATCVTRAH